MVGAWTKKIIGDAQKLTYGQTQGQGHAEGLASVVKDLESGGRETNAQGKTLTSPKGAAGIMQVMPATRDNPGFGVEPARDDGPKERARVGRDYITAMMQRYGGNEALALAAYNAGPGTVDQWLETVGDPRTGEISNAEWAARLPYPETQKYVQKGLSKLAGSTGSLAGQEQKALADVEQIEDPVVRETVRKDVASYYAAQQKAQENRRKEVKRQAYAAIDKGYRLDDMPPDQQAQLSDILGEDMKGLRDYQNQRGQIKTDWKTYSDLMVMASDNPAAFAQLDPYHYRGVLADQQFTALVSKQAEVKKAHREGQQKPADSGRVITVAQRMMDAAGWSYGTGTKKTSDKERTRAGRVIQRAEEIAEAAHEKGETLTEAQIRQKLSPLFLDMGGKTGAQILGASGWLGDLNEASLDDADDQAPIIATTLGLPVDVVKTSMKALQEQGGHWYKTAPVSLDAIRASATTSLAQQTGAPAEFVGRLLAWNEGRGLPMTVADVAFAWRQASLTQGRRDRAWGDQ